MSMIAVPVATPGLDGQVEPRFGRAPHILLVEAKTMEWEVVENPGGHAGGGAGVQAAQLLAGRKVDAVVSVEFGPTARAALSEAGIRMHICPAGTTAREAVEEFRQGGSAVWKREAAPEGGSADAAQAGPARQPGGGSGGGATGRRWRGQGQGKGEASGEGVPGRGGRGKGGGARGRGRGRRGGGGAGGGRGRWP
jgi:predicted Fe-Mo cluster-binding NifX family protein